MQIERVNQSKVTFSKSDLAAVDKVKDMLQNILDEMEVNDYIYWDTERLSASIDKVRNSIGVLDNMYVDGILL